MSHITYNPKMLFIFQVGSKHGWGHKYRVLETARVAREKGIPVEVVSNDIEATGFRLTIGSKSPHLDKGRLSALLNRLTPEWVVYDLSKKPTQDIIDKTRSKPVKIANLNGLGHNLEADSWADFSWVQDSPEKVILRKDLLKVKHEPITNNWFVFGGSVDELNLLENFENVIQRDPALLIGTELRQPMTPKFANHTYIESSGPVIMQHMRYASRAAVHMGMICYELAAIGVPQYIFSRSEEHLRYAKMLESYGLGLAYPKVGLPEPNEMRKFFMEPIVLNPNNKPDCMGADRFLDAIMKAG